MCIGSYGYAISYACHVEIGGNWLVSNREENQADRHHQDGEKIDDRISLALDENAANHHRNQFATFENDLRRIIQISQRCVWASHCSDREKGQKGVGENGNLALTRLREGLLQETKNGVKKELHQGQVPPVRLEVSIAEDQLLQIAVQDKEEENRNGTCDELARPSQRGQRYSKHHHWY